MKRLTIMLLMLTLMLPVAVTSSFAQSTEQEIQQLKQMVEQNRKQNEELMKRIEQLESEKATTQVQVDKFITEQEKKNTSYDDLLSLINSINVGFSVDTTYQYVFNRGATDS